MKATEAESKPVLEAVYEAWKIGLFADGKPADGEEAPPDAPPLLLKPEAERTEAETKQIAAGTPQCSTPR